MPRPGAEPEFTEEQICLIVAMFCDKPEDHGYPLSHWSGIYPETDECRDQPCLHGGTVVYESYIPKKAVAAREADL